MSTQSLPQTHPRRQRSPMTERQVVRFLAAFAYLRDPERALVRAIRREQKRGAR